MSALERTLREFIREEGLALCDPALVLIECDERFAQWFPSAAPGAALAEIVADLKPERAIKRLDKRGRYDLEIDRPAVIGAGPSRIGLSMRRVERGGEALVGVIARDESRLREKDEIIRSHARTIERSNRELKRKTGELEEKNEQLRALSSKLGKYLSPQVYQSIFTGENQVKVETYRKPLTVFFSDLQGFTSLTDRLEPEQLAGVLNTYLTEMSAIANRFGGTIDKFIGDGILIFFGDPNSLGEREDALACTLMALEMRQRMVELREQWWRQGIVDPLSVRMGINSGFCTVGNFGSEARLEYTVVGGQVNLASRLEGAAAPDEVLISESTRALIGEEVICEDRGELTLKGIANPVRAFAVVRYYQERRDRELAELSESFEGFEVHLDLRRADKNQAVKALRRLIDQLELELLKPQRRE